MPSDPAQTDLCGEPGWHWTARLGAREAPEVTLDASAEALEKSAPMAAVGEGIPEPS